MNTSTINKYQSGFTLIEVVIAIVIISIISVIVYTPLHDYQSRQTLNASVESVLAAFSAAHLDTMSSRNDATYGVHIKSDEVIYFSGVTYPGDGDAANVHFVLPASIEIADISLNGGGSTVFYKRLSGATDNYGTFDVRLKSKTSLKITTTINQTGAMSI